MNERQRNETRIVHVFREVSDTEYEAQRFAALLARMGMAAKVVRLTGGSGHRVIVESDDTFEFIDYLCD